MTDDIAAGDRHDQARDLAEQGLDKLVQGDEGGADALLAQSKALDPSAAPELVDDLDEDSADPDEEADEDDLDDDEEDEADDDDDDDLDPADDAVEEDEEG